jgi:hypothetical protein
MFCNDLIHYDSNSKRAPVFCCSLSNVHVFYKFFIKYDFVNFNDIFIAVHDKSFKCFFSFVFILSGGKMSFLQMNNRTIKMSET